ATWDCRTGQERYLTPEGLKTVGVSMTAQLAALRGRLAGDPAEALHIWDLAGGKRVGEISGLREFPSKVDFSPNGRFLVFDDPADQGQSIRVWDLRLHKFTQRLLPPPGFALSTDRPLRSFVGEFLEVFGQLISFNPDGSLLARAIFAGQQSSLCIWDISAGNVLTTLPSIF